MCANLRIQVSELAEEADLREMFSRWGHVTRVFLAKDRETGRAKGFAFVSYADRTDAARACEKMDGCKFHLTLLDLVCGFQNYSNILCSRVSPSYFACRVREEIDLGICVTIYYLFACLGLAFRQP